jgi:hypothetical protein
MEIRTIFYGQSQSGLGEYTTRCIYWITSKYQLKSFERKHMKKGKRKKVGNENEKGRKRKDKK